MEFTDKELRILQEYIDDDIVNDYGWRDELSATWSDGFGRNIKDIPQSSISGICASLTKKEIFSNNGESFCLTSKGREEVASLIEKQLLKDH